MWVREKGGAPRGALAAGSEPRLPQQFTGHVPVSNSGSCDPLGKRPATTYHSRSLRD